MIGRVDTELETSGDDPDRPTKERPAERLSVSRPATGKPGARKPNGRGGTRKRSAAGWMGGTDGAKDGPTPS